MADGYEKIPELTMLTLINYRDHHLRPGSFVMSVLENNLFEAVGRADLQNRSALPEIVKWVVNQLHPAPYMNKVAIQKWIDQGSDVRWG